MLIRDQHFEIASDGLSRVIYTFARPARTRRAEMQRLQEFALTMSRLWRMKEYILTAARAPDYCHVHSTSDMDDPEFLEEICTPKRHAWTTIEGNVVTEGWVDQPPIRSPQSVQIN